MPMFPPSMLLLAIRMFPWQFTVSMDGIDPLGTKLLSWIKTLVGPKALTLVPAKMAGSIVRARKLTPATSHPFPMVIAAVLLVAVRMGDVEVKAGMVKVPCVV